MVGTSGFFRNAIPKGVWAVWEPAVPPHLHPDDPGLYQRVSGATRAAARRPDPGVTPVIHPVTAVERRL
ncbi:hypothetical protein GCM10028775_38290 [Catellatospora paridis]